MLDILTKTKQHVWKAVFAEKDPEKWEDLAKQHQNQEVPVEDQNEQWLND